MIKHPKTIHIITKGHDHVKECREVVLQYYYPQYQLVVNKGLHDPEVEISIEVDGGNEILLEFQSECYHLSDRILIDSTMPIQKQIKRKLFLFLRKITGKELPWGILTGIRPVKIAHYQFIRGLSDDEVRNSLHKDYLITEEKAQKVIDLAKIEIDVMYPLDKRKAVLYVGIPFCPTRCSYCSFISSTVDNRELLNAYLQALGHEIDKLCGYLDKENIQISSIYVGGGTPSVLNPSEIAKLFEQIYKHISKYETMEITFEAGRPDTVNKEMLKVLHDVGVNRMSINPQTLNDNTLKSIGRNHTAKQFFESMELARSVGMDNINTDLILGLANETTKDVEHTIRKVMELSPENITIHNLSIKKSSVIKENLDDYSFKTDSLIKEMNEIAENMMVEKKYNPYYLYRQQYTQGNLENTGYSLPGKEGIYNISIMSEKTSVIGIGAGSSGKLFYPEIDLLERMETVKDIKTYIETVDQICERKSRQMEKVFHE